MFFWFADEQPDMKFLTKFADYVASMNERCKQQGKAFVYVNSPEKKQIYKEYIPDYVPEPLDNFEYLAPLLEERQVPYLDLTDDLMQARAEGIEVFHKVFDAGHWNSEGALVCAKAIIAYIQNIGYDVEQPNIEKDYETKWEHYDYLPASVIPYPVETYYYEHRKNGTQAIDVTEENEPVVLDEQFKTCHVWRNDACANNLNLLMFQGSYFNTHGTVLYNQFAQTECIHDYMNVFYLDEYLKQYDPDIVVFESANYTLYESYYSFERFEEASDSEE